MKKLVLAILAGMLLLMLQGAALACSNPDGCDRNTYRFVRDEADGHWLECTGCGYQFKEPHWGERLPVHNVRGAHGVQQMGLTEEE